MIEVFLANSRKVGAQSLLTLPLAGFVAADFDGAVAETEAAPSRRFLPVDWSGPHREGGERRRTFPSLLERLVARHGGAAEGGVRGYYLDNEPGLWAQTHPRIVKTRMTIRSLIERSLRAAAAIKSADPEALVFGPASWGATEMVNFQNAPDWGDYRSHGSFLAAYLDAFRREFGTRRPPAARSARRALVSGKPAGRPVPQRKSRARSQRCSTRRARSTSRLLREQLGRRRARLHARRAASALAAEPARRRRGEFSGNGPVDQRI